MTMVDGSQEGGDGGDDHHFRDTDTVAGGLRLAVCVLQSVFRILLCKSGTMVGEALLFLGVNGRCRSIHDGPAC